MNSINVINDSFSQYSAAVIQSRALVDARDGLKPSADRCTDNTYP